MRNPFEYLDHREKMRKSNTIFYQSEYEKITNKRIRNMMILIVVLFSILFLQLLNIQILQHERYLSLLATQQKTSVYEGTSRGEIYDRNGNKVVSTVTVLSISYFPKDQNLKPEEVNQLALKFAKQFHMTSKELSEDDLKVLFIRLYGEEAESLLSEDEINRINNTELDGRVSLKERLIKNHITTDMLNRLTEDERLIFLVSERMNYYGNSNDKRMVLQGVQPDDLAYLVEHTEDFPGFEPNYTNWERQYAGGENRTFQSVLGQVSSATQGLPANLSDRYLAKGYALSDRVGTSGLEQQYEDLLFGTKTLHSISTNESGEMVSTVVEEGKKGYDLHLTIDFELQKYLDELIKRELTAAKTQVGRSNFKEAYVTLMNPQTGEIYAMSGIATAEDGSFYEFAAGNYMSAYQAGSSVKGATIYMALNEEVIQPGEVIYDAPLEIQGTTPKGSYTNHGNVSDISALEKSSNVYMFQIAIRMGGGTYVPKQALNITDENAKEAFKLMRNYYSSFGLGVSSGIDVPNEMSSGFIGNDRNIGNLLDFTIGQYDSYTTLQLSTYAAIIANGGYSVTPRLVANATDVNDNNHIVYENPISINNHLIGNTEYLDRVSQGFRNCVVGTTGRSYCGGGLNQLPFPVYAKTGTAEVGSNGETNNSALIGYVATENPQLAFACMAPESADTSNIGSLNNVCSTIINDLLIEANKRGYIDSN